MGRQGIDCQLAVAELAREFIRDHPLRRGHAVSDEQEDVFWIVSRLQSEDREQHEYENEDFFHLLIPFS